MNAVLRTRTVAIILVIIAIVISIYLLFTYSATLLLAGITMLVFSGYIARRDAYIVFRSKKKVGLILDKTLVTLGLSYERNQDIISISKTGTKIIIKKAGPVSYMQFLFVMTESKSELYIADVVLKQQR